jgi:hypothetical protein
MRSNKSTRADKHARAKRRIRLTGAIGPKATVSAVIIVLAGGMLVAARQQARPTPVPAKDVRLTMTPASNARALAAPRETAAPSLPVTDMTVTVTPTSGSKGTPTTVTGCVERTDEGYRLKDTSGTDAPKARSWKSGFLKKGSASVDLVDAAHALKPSDAGHRVSVTGTLVDREMRVRSVKRVAPSCR